MAGTRRTEVPKTFVDYLAVKPFCESIDPTITPEQRFALHEFLHTMLAAGYKLYQTVPPDMASKIIIDKFSGVIRRLSPP